MARIRFVLNLTKNTFCVNNFGKFAYIGAFVKDNQSGEISVLKSFISFIYINIFGQLQEKQMI